MVVALFSELAITQAAQQSFLKYHFAGALGVFALLLPMVLAVSVVPGFGVLLAAVGAAAFYPALPPGSPVHNYYTVLATWTLVTAVVAFVSQVVREAAKADAAYIVTVVESATEAIITLSAQYLVISWNPAAERLYGYSRKEMIGHSFLPLIPAQEYALFASIMDRAFNGGTRQAVVQRRTKQGHIRRVDATTSPVWIGGEVVAVSSIARDMTDELNLQQEVNEIKDDRDRTEASRRELANRLLSAEEEERQRIAQELHDDTIQVMASTALMFEAVRRSIAPEAMDGSGDTYDLALSMLRDCLTRTRHLMFELHPAVLEHQGLEPAVREIVDGATQIVGAKSQVEVSTGRFDPIMEALVFRVVRECIHNVRKHSQARELSIRIHREGDRIVGRIEDDGIGFDLPSVIEQQQGIYKHLGLASLVERVHLAGGEAHIRTSPGAGCSIRFWVPVVPQVMELEATAS